MEFIAPEKLTGIPTPPLLPAPGQKHHTDDLFFLYSFYIHREIAHFDGVQRTPNELLIMLLRFIKRAAAVLY